MCTLTIVPTDSGVRLASNRDESRGRPLALAPQIVPCGQRLASYPTDPQGGGTWIAGNSAGIAFSLLNVNRKPGLSLGNWWVSRSDRGSLPAKLSRGRIIPCLASAGTMDEALDRCRYISAEDYLPFRLLIVNRWNAIELVSDGARILPARVHDIGQPLMFTSSGLGDHMVEGPRRRLFCDWFQSWRIRERGRTSVPQHGVIDEFPFREVGMQDAFHQHSWPGRKQLSVCMSRTDARTVSFTTVEIGRAEVRLMYHANAPDQIGDRTHIRLPYVARNRAVLRRHRAAV